MGRPCDGCIQLKVLWHLFFNFSSTQPRKDFSHIEDGASSRKVPKMRKKRGVRDVALITVKRSDSKWSDSWQSQQATTLRDLELEDMAMNSDYKPGQVPADAVTVDLAVQKVSKITQWRN